MDLSYYAQASHGIQYSKPRETTELFIKGIMSDAAIAKDLPRDTADAATHLRFTGHDSPSLPVNWRLAEAVSALKGLEACLVNVLLKQKYKVDMQDVVIDTDKATLFIFSLVLWTIDPEGENITSTKLRAANSALNKYFPSCDKCGAGRSQYRSLATNIYKTSDGRFFNLHGSLNPDPTLDSIGLPHDMDTPSYDEGTKPYASAVGKFDSQELQRLNSEVYKQAGTICYSVEEYRASEHGKANAHVGLWEIHDHATSQPPAWWPHAPHTGPERPLAGLKVVDLTRIIAAPAITRGLAELGASVMRCTSPDLPDLSGLHVDLSWGKWNCSIDLHREEDREKLRALILEADVVVQGYRPGALDKYGFGQQAIIEMCAKRDRGIISVRENCYGWHGPWQDRSGWQQISDASVGLSTGFGRALGHGEPVTPVFPHSDYCTGLSGTCAILIALLRRGEKGGSYAVDLALNYYSQWMANAVGEYPTSVFQKVWNDECGGQIWRHWHNNTLTVPAVLERLREGPGGKRIFKPEFFEERAAPVPFGNDTKKVRCVKPIADWNDVVKLGFAIGTRGNGLDASYWPQDLLVQQVV